jgi:sec-independent protein translocase protein TatA
MPFGVVELLIVGVIILAIFGVGRLGDLGGAIGRTIQNFKSEMKTGKEQ